MKRTTLENNEINSKYPNIDFIQGTSSQIEKRKKENKIQDGALYFVLDTKQILLGKSNKDGLVDLIPMGKSTGVRFVNKETDLKSVNLDTYFELNDLEDKSCYPQIDDLLFNNLDGCFYRVTAVDANASKNNITTSRITVAGSGGGGGGGGSFGGNSANISMEFASEPQEDDIPAYITKGQSGKCTIKRKVYLYINDVESKNTITQTYTVCNKKVTTSVKAGSELIIEIPYSQLERTTDVGLQYYYQGFTLTDYSLNSVIVVDTDISDPKGDFALSIESPTKNGLVNYTGSVAITKGSQQKIFVSLKDTEGNLVTNTDTIQYYPADCYPVYDTDGNIVEYYYDRITETDINTTMTSKNFAIQFSNLSYGTYTLEARQEIYYDNQVFISPTYMYSFVSVLVPEGQDVENYSPLMVCDFSAVENKTFTNADTIYLPVTVYDPLAMKTAEKGFVSVTYGPKNNETTQNKTITYGVRSSISIIKPPAHEEFYPITVTYSRTNPDGTEFSTSQTIMIFVKISDVNNLIPDIEFSANGYRNSDVDRKNPVWKNTGLDPRNFSIQFNNFTWSDGITDISGTGWCQSSATSSEYVLRVGGDSSLTMDINPFTIGTLTKNGCAFFVDFNVRNFTKRSKISQLENQLENVIVKCCNENFGLKIYGDYIKWIGAEKENIAISFKENDRIHLGVVITPLYPDHDNRGLIQLYINGIMVAARIYNNSHVKLNDINISIGNPDTIIDIYSISMYSRYLEFQDILKLYLNARSETLNGDEIARKNSICDSAGNIILDEVLPKTGLPVMILTGELPRDKADKGKTVNIEFRHPDSRFDFKQENVPIEVQGTSSQFYPVKNYKIKKVLKGKYLLADGQVETGTYCLKADYAESTSSHNTQNANFVETLYPLVGAELNPAQVEDSRCRTTIYGYPIVVFHAAPNESPKFLGKYNFNFDKGSKEVFGFKTDANGVPNGECWEFKDNSNVAAMEPDAVEKAKFGWDKWKVEFTFGGKFNASMVKYFPLQESEILWDETSWEGKKWSEERHTNIDYVRWQIQKYYEYQQNEGDDTYKWSFAKYDNERIVPMWATYFEPRYCEKRIVDENGRVVKYKTDVLINAANNEYEEEDVYDISNFANLYDWIMSTKDDSRKFANEVGDHFDMAYLLVYYVYTHFAMMVDQRAKNMFFTYWEPYEKDGKTYGGKWQPWFYDNDTCFGIDNDGLESFDYSSEDDNTDAAQIFQGENSVLWNNLKAEFETELGSVYNTLRQNQLKQEVLDKYFIDESVAKFPAAIYNADAKAKYIDYAYDPIVVDQEGTEEEVIFKLRGDGLTAYRRFMPDRFNYCDGKWKIFNKDKAILMRPLILDNNDENNGDSGEKQSYSIDFEPFSTGYYSYYFGAESNFNTNQDLFAPEGQIVDRKMEANITYKKDIEMPYAGGNVTYFAFGADIADLGDLSQFTPTQFFASECKKMKKLQIGNQANTPILDLNSINNNTAEKVNDNRKNIQNIRLTSLALTSPSLQILDISNIDFSSATIELDKCPNIRKVYAKNSNLPNLSLGNGGYINELILSDTIKELSLKNQICLTEDKIYFENNRVGTTKNPYRNLSSIIVENCDNLNTKALLNKCLGDINSFENDLPDSSQITKKIIRITGIDYKKDDQGNPVRVNDDSEAIPIYDNWVFENNAEFENFVLHFEKYFKSDSPIALRGLLDNGNESDKPLLEGVCYVNGDGVDGNLKERFLSLISSEGKFEILSVPSSTKYPVRFFYIDPYTNEVVQIKKKDGSNYELLVTENTAIGNPYLDLLEWSNGDVVGVKQYPEGFITYTHTYEDFWKVVDRGSVPTDADIAVDLEGYKITKSCDMYAVYNVQSQQVPITFYNAKLGPKYKLFDTTVSYGTAPIEDRDLRVKLMTQYSKGKLEYPAEGLEKKEEWEHSGDWSPSIMEKVTAPTNFLAHYYYKAWKTLTLLSKTIRIFKTDLGTRLPEYLFYGCNDLQKVILAYNKDGIVSFNDTTFSNSSIKEDIEENGQLVAGGTGRIYVPYEKLNEYLAETDTWGKYSKSITYITEIEEKEE